MTRHEILELVRENPVSHMATVEGGSPRVRAMETPIVDEKGLTFLTGTHKDVCRQLLADPSVELCYWSPEKGLQLRIRGMMELLSDESVKREIVETKFTFLKPVVERNGWKALSVFRLSGGTVRVWSGSDPAGGSKTYEF